MYKNKLAVAIKSNGKILRETKDIVHIPFGSEFSVLVKNLNSTRVKFTLHIDGTDALDGTEIIVNANSETEVKRFIRNGNLNEGNAFKFIERTSAIEDGPRGIKIDDGVVRVEYWFEKEEHVMYRTVVHVDEYYRKYMPPVWNGPYWAGNNVTYGSGISGQSMGGVTGDSFTVSSANSINTVFTAQAASATTTTKKSLNSGEITRAIPATASVNDVGITVPGSKVEQQFHTVYGFKVEEQSHVIILKLAGMSGEVEVTVPITVAHRPECSTCGRKNKATNKFCSQCGTALTLF